jgi:hypothetical protein
MLRWTAMLLRTGDKAKKRRLMDRRHRNSGTFRPQAQVTQTRTHALRNVSSEDGLKQRKYGERYGGSQLARETDHANKLYALQGFGDNESLAHSAQFGVRETDVLAHGEDQVHSRVEAPATYTPLMARKLAQGEFWPSMRTLDNPALHHPSQLMHEDNMSPSERRFSQQVEYFLRRNFRACPAAIGEHIDFTQLSIERCYVTKRCRQLYIVWTTTDGVARQALEPYLCQLNQWVIRTIKERVKVKPNIPKVFWVYNTGLLQKELPRKLTAELKAVQGRNSMSLEARVQHLKQLDTLEHRMKGVPWFMPYLWSKDKLGRDQKTMAADLDTVEQRKAAGAAGDAAMKPPTYVP